MLEFVIIFYFDRDAFLANHKTYAFGSILAAFGSLLVSFWLHVGPFGSILTP
jgi:hypothetical protein